MIKNYLLLLAMLLIATFSFAQSSSVKGKITTADGQPAAFVNVQVKGQTKVIPTDEDGQFEISNLQPGTYTIVVSHTGLKTVEKQVIVPTDKNFTLNVTLDVNEKQLDAVVVSGRRTLNEKKPTLGKAGLNPMDNPQTVGVVSSVVIADQQVNRLGDVLKNVSGVSLTQQRQGVAETFSSRGYSVGIGGAGGSIFKNGIVSNTQGFPEASTLESIEVLKGSSALLYGNTSGGLIINMVTKKPKFDWGGEVSMRAGSYSLYKPIVDIYGPISKNLAFRVVGTYENAKSYRDVVKTRRTYANPSLLYKIGKKTTLLVQGDYLDANFTPDNGIGIINQNIDPVIPPSRSRFINTSWAYYKTKQASGTVNLDHAFTDNLKLNFIGGVSSTKIDAYGTNVPNTVLTSPYGDWARSLARTKTGEDDYTLQLNLNAKFSTGFLKHQALIGTDYVAVATNSYNFKLTSYNGTVGTAYDRINIVDMNRYVQRNDIPTAQDTSHLRTPSYRLGYYIQDLISITDKLKVLAGVRFSYLENQPNTTTYFLQNNREAKGALAVNRAWSPKAAIIYEPTKNTSLYASYANNFTVNTRVDINTRSQLPPSYIDQYELGIKNIFWNGKLSANLSLYRIKNSNLVQAVFFDATNNPLTNVGELTGQTTSDGLEVDLNGSLSRNFYFIAGYSYNNARYTGSRSDSGSVVLGEQLINNPRHTANGTLFYTLPTTALKGLKLGVSGFYTGKRLGGVQNTVKQKPVYNRQIPLTGFTTFDISAGYTYKQFSVLAKLSNLFNTLNYLAHDRYSINPIPPRQLVATVSYKF